MADRAPTGARPGHRRPSDGRRGVQTEDSGSSRCRASGRRPGGVRRLVNGHPERGGHLSLYTVIIAVVLILMVGLVVDGGGMVHAYQRANAICREAARTAGQAIAFTDDGQAALNQSAARQAGKKYLEAQGCADGTVTVSGRTVAVTCRYGYDPTFLPGSYHVTGEGKATAERVR